MLGEFQIEELSASHLEHLKDFTDREIGKDYYRADELEQVIERSKKMGLSCSFVLVDSSGTIQGVRFSFPPGNWQKGKGEGLSPQLWPHALDETAYFQSIFLSPECQGLGVGRQLSELSLARLKQAGARGVVCHSWKESPHNSSMRYLEKLGFQPICEYPGYWKNSSCSICPSAPCTCTAVEMYLELEAK